jgi:hypothetical protein
MLYLFSGDDAKSKIANYEKFIKSIPSDTEIFTVSRNNFDTTQLESLYSGASLFSPLSAVILSGVTDYEETRDFVLSRLKHMGESRNSFVFLEGKLSKPITDAFKKARAEINIFELPKEKKERYDNFLVANAFANKDKLHTWIYFRQAMDAGVVMEEIIGVLFWKIKDMLLKNDFNKFSPEQLKVFVAKISYLLPEARKQGRDAEAAFERFLLEAF